MLCARIILKILLRHYAKDVIIINYILITVIAKNAKNLF